MTKARVEITLKEGVLDPQGKAVRHALEALGFEGVGEVRIGKLIEIDLDGAPGAELEARVREMCERLLANTVIEDYRFRLEA
ncbi:MAG: phosphoribosylformylglycinamidine synthase subunit PurS [Nitrospirae bacterium]|nr:MAG: phosphoribosylformylglycinamidine synthase subunit PurS [Nitrospirota bacterium]